MIAVLKRLLSSTIITLLCAGAAWAAPVYTYSWTTTSQGFGPHVDQPTYATFDVAASVVQTGTIGYNDITNIQMAYPGLAFDNTAVSSIGWTFSVPVDPVTGALQYQNPGQGLAVVAYAGDSINDMTTFLSITVGSPVGNTVMDQFNALNNGSPWAGFPTAGYWTARFVDDGTGNPVPEPGTLALLALGCAGAAATRRRKS